MKHKLWHRAAFVLLGSVAIAACSDSTDPAPTATAIEAVSATTTSGAAGQPAPIQPSVRVLGAGGAPAAGVVVQFRVTSGLGSVQFADVLTDASGVATAGVWILGPHPGVHTVTASAAGAAPVVFSSNTTVGPPNKITTQGWVTQTSEPFATVPIDISVRLTDFFNQIHAGTPVTFTVISGGGTIAGQTAVTVNTNAQGIATTGPWVLGGTPGVQQLQAQAGTATVLFTAIACPTFAFTNPTNGTLTNTGCVINDLFRNNYAYTTTAGQAILIEMTSGDFNTFLNLSTTGGIPLGLNNNATDNTTNSALRWIPATSGTVIIGAGAAVAGATGNFTLTVNNTTSAVTGCEPETYIQVGVTNLAQALTTTDCMVAGTTPFYTFSPGAPAYQADVFRVQLAAGQQIRIRMAPTTDMDALLAVFSPTGARNFADDGFDGGAEELVYTAASTGIYRIVFTSYGLAGDDPWGHEFGPYTLSIRNP